MQQFARTIWTCEFTSHHVVLVTYIRPPTRPTDLHVGLLEDGASFFVAPKIPTSIQLVPFGVGIVVVGITGVGIVDAFRVSHSYYR